MSNGTWVKKICNCDVCGEIARFDAAARRGAWGNFCLACWSDHCPRALGTGIGQMLVRDGENPRAIAVELSVDDLVIVSDRR
jgi:alkylhydroperoxidase family enzyme